VTHREMYRITLACDGVPAAEGDEAANEIAHEFRDHRSHHSDVSCSYAGGTLTLVAENDFDPCGLALLDEFGDCLSAYLRGWDGGIRLISVVAIHAS